MPVVRSQTRGLAEPPRQFTQPSRKGKKAWRKNVDLTEVEHGLVELNEEIIRGGVIREKDSAELFTIDKQGDSKISEKFPKHSKKTLKADEILAQRSSVPAVSLRKRPGDKTTPGTHSTKRSRVNWVPHKELVHLRRIADGQHDMLLDARDASYDVWGAVATNQPEALDFLPESQSAKLPKSMKQRPISLAASGKEIPAVAKPNGGHSYNPLATDYETRLAEESAKALEAEQARLSAEEEERKKQEASARSAAEAEAAEERANLSEWEDDSEWEGFQSGVEEDQPSTKRPGRKTQAQRNRIKRRKEEERLAKHRTAMKAKRLQEENIKRIADELNELEQKKGLEKVEDSDSEADETLDDKLRKKQLGKFKLPEKDLELVLPDELEESLRRLRPEGNLLKDRYRNLLVRGKLESRRHIPFKKQARRKVTEKWSHKDFLL